MSFTGLHARQSCGCPNPPVPVPFLGGPSGGCSCGGAKVMTVRDDCACTCDCGCGGAGQGGCGGGCGQGGGTRSGDPLGAAKGKLAALVGKVVPSLPGAQTGPAVVGLPRLNLSLQLSTPDAGPFAPLPVLTYNAAAAGSSIQFGRGWSDRFNPTVASIDSTTAKLIDGTGAAITYINKDGSGKYQAPAWTPNALVQNAGGSWTETQPDGFKLNYATSGLLRNMVSPASGIWTIMRDGELLKAHRRPVQPPHELRL